MPEEPRAHFLDPMNGDCWVLTTYLTQKGEFVVESREPIEVLPSAARMIKSLRDVGYSFRGAVADLVDNSIAANATRVAITMKWAGTESFVRIADDGDGMSPDRITESLRFGSERDYDPDDLGKFGFGLKTASLSQCKRILVASRPAGDDNGIHARRFDQDFIVEHDAWVIESVPEADLPPEASEPLRDRGTAVVWSKLDRILGDHFQDTNKARDRFLDHAEDLERHLGMVFHKFLEGNATKRQGHKLTISINDRKIAPWNPFALNEPATKQFSDDQLEITGHGVAGTVRSTAWVLPRKDQFSSEKEFERLSGPSKWNQQQGFYIYRSDRLIQSGGWSRMGAADEHTKQARVALEFFPELDAAFEINISKMTVSLPATLRDLLKPKIAALRGQAKRSYGQAAAAKKNIANKGKPQTDIDAQREKLDVPPPKLPTNGKGVIPVSPANSGASFTEPAPWPPAPMAPPERMIRTRRTSLERAAEAIGESEALQRIMDALIDENPRVAHELGW